MMKQVLVPAALAFTLLTHHFVAAQAPEGVDLPQPEVVENAKEMAAKALSNEEILEMVGYYMAQATGVSTLSLDSESIQKVGAALEKALAGELTIESFGMPTVQAAMGEVQARGEAIEKILSSEAAPAEGDEPSIDLRELTDAEKETLPAIDDNALEILGVVVAVQSRITDLGFDADEVTQIIPGFLKGAAAIRPSEEALAKSPAMSEYLQNRAQSMQAKQMAEAAAAADKNKADGAAFIEALEGVESTESGLHYEVLREGEGEKPTMEDTVLVHYEGTRIDGTKFDSSYDRGEPVDFPMNGVVAGFSEGLTKIAPGGKVKLYIPSDLAYGDNPRPGVIQPGDTLVFTCELIRIESAE